MARGGQRSPQDPAPPAAGHRAGSLHLCARAASRDALYGGCRPCPCRTCPRPSLQPVITTAGGQCRGRGANRISGAALSGLACQESSLGGSGPLIACPKQGAGTRPAGPCKHGRPLPVCCRLRSPGQPGRRFRGALLGSQHGHRQPHRGSQGGACPRRGGTRATPAPVGTQSARTALGVSSTLTRTPEPPKGTSTLDPPSSGKEDHLVDDPSRGEDSSHHLLEGVLGTRLSRRGSQSWGSDRMVARRPEELLGPAHAGVQEPFLETLSKLASWDFGSGRGQGSTPGSPLTVFCPLHLPPSCSA